MEITNKTTALYSFQKKVKLKILYNFYIFLKLNKI